MMTTKLIITICILIAIAAFEGGFIVANWQRWDIHGRQLNHETRISILESEYIKPTLEIQKSKLPKKIP